MPYYGKQLMARDFVSYVNIHWPNQKVKAVATAIAESQLSVGALHDNKDVITDLREGQQACNVETYELCTVVDPDSGQIKLSDGSTVEVPLTTEWIVSRDCGVYQINIQARYINGPYEFTLRTEEKLFDWYEPVVKTNVKAAYQLWSSPWIRDGKNDFRRWQPWVAYTSGWAMYPEAWAWHRDKDGKPVGPWVQSGRYLHKAIRGVANWYLYNTKTMTADEALAEAKRLAAQYGITKGYLTYNAKNGVYWVYPPAPTEAPTGEPWGYPVKNNGF